MDMPKWMGKAHTASIPAERTTGNCIMIGAGVYFRDEHIHQLVISYQMVSVGNIHKYHDTVR